MKATGIVRRIDDLGRVVIPKEIRRTMRIREGDPLEIFTASDGEVIFKKYSPIGELSEFEEPIYPISGMSREAAVAYPIIGSGDVSGCVVLLLNSDGSLPSETERKLVAVAASFLGKQMEE